VRAARRSRANSGKIGKLMGLMGVTGRTKFNLVDGYFGHKAVDAGESVSISRSPDDATILIAPPKHQGPTGAGRRARVSKRSASIHPKPALKRTGLFYACSMIEKSHAQIGKPSDYPREERSREPSSVKPRSRRRIHRHHGQRGLPRRQAEARRATRSAARPSIFRGQKVLMRNSPSALSTASISRCARTAGGFPQV